MFPTKEHDRRHEAARNVQAEHGRGSSAGEAAHGAHGAYGAWPRPRSGNIEQR